MPQRKFNAFVDFDSHICRCINSEQFALFGITCGPSLIYIQPRLAVGMASPLSPLAGCRRLRIVVAHDFGSYLQAPSAFRSEFSLSSHQVSNLQMQTRRASPRDLLIFGFTAWARMSELEMTFGD